LCFLMFDVLQAERPAARRTSRVSQTPSTYLFVIFYSKI
jgi:hypothetical protein